MALPLSGPISMNDIRAELGVPSQTNFDINTARTGGYVSINQNSYYKPPQGSGTQVSLSDWRGYCQSCNSFSLSYSSTSTLACENNDPITILSDTPTIGVGSYLYLSDYSPAFYPYYYSDGSNWYYLEMNGSEQVVVTSTGACGGPPPPSYDFYLADEYSCFPCTLQNTNVPVCFPAGTGVYYNRYYNDLSFDGFVYRLQSTNTTTTSLILTTTGSGTNCNTVCSV
jgi:hypothetical protein